jgi:hypothetical protein
MPCSSSRYSVTDLVAPVAGLVGEDSNGVSTVHDGFRRFAR